jgi:hypothetical protein
MYFKKSLLVAIAASSLFASAIIETSQAPVQAKSVSTSVAPGSRSISTAPATVLTQYGPTGCVDGSTIKIIDGTTKSKSMVELATSCAKYDASATAGDVTAIGLLLSDKTTIPPTTPTGTITLLSNTPEIVYSLGLSTAGINPTITPTGQLTIAPVIGTLDGSVTILATQTYVESTRSNFTYSAQVQFVIPVLVRPALQPTCQIFTISTSVNTPVSVPLAYDALRAGGCQGGYGTLTYSVGAVAPNNGTSTKDSDTSALFSPTGGFQTPADNSVKANFAISVTDEYGQTSLALDQYSGVIAGAAGATVTVNVSEPRDCGGWVPKTETIFNNPLAGTSRDGKLSNSRFAITNRINNMIDCAPVGSTIAMSWFSFTDDNMVNHLIQAYRNGVNVRVLVNSHATKKSSSSFTAVNTLRAVLGSNVTDATANASENTGSWLASCDSGCLTPTPPAGLVFPDEEGEYPALHSKFFMITRAGSAKNIVGISSVNPTFEQAKVGFNNASVVVNDRTLFTSMNKYYADLANAARGVSKATAYRQLKSDSKTTAYYVYPKSGSDDILTMLRDIKCIYRAGNKTMRTEIYVNMFVFTRNAPAMELWHKAFNSKGKNGGCNVHIIYTDMDQRIKALNTKNGKYDFIPNGTRPSAWGVADCLSTYPKKSNGKYNPLTAPGLIFDETKNRMVAAKVCKNGSLQGSIPTINKAGGYCWFKYNSKLSGGTLDMCISSPMKVTALDKADNRAKLEPVEDATGKRWYSHQKYIAIDGMYGKSGKQTRQQIVISGTPNITSPGQRWNDEILTFTTSPEIYAQYVANFKDMKSAILHRPGPSGLWRAEY